MQKNKKQLKEDKKPYNNTSVGDKEKELKIKKIFELLNIEYNSKDEDTNSNEEEKKSKNTLKIEDNFKYEDTNPNEDEKKSKNTLNIDKSPLYHLMKYVKYIAI